MKKIILLFICVINYSCYSTKTTENTISEKESKKPIYYDFEGKLDEAQLTFLKNNYHWKDEKILIINYNQPISFCHFDNNKITPESKKWSENFYKKINTENCLIIKVLANGERVQNKLDDIKYFDDKMDFLQMNFFYKRKSCFGVLVLNQFGDYVQYNGHYDEDQVDHFIKVLKNKN